MEIINNSGKWLVENGVSMLIEPTQEWRYKNQGAWLNVEQIDRTIIITAYDVIGDTFNVNIGGSDAEVVIVYGEASAEIELDETVSVGDTLLISAIHPGYGYAEKVVTIIE